MYIKTTECAWQGNPRAWEEFRRDKPRGRKQEQGFWQTASIKIETSMQMVIEGDPVLCIPHETIIVTLGSMFDYRGSMELSFKHRWAYARRKWAEGFKRYTCPRTSILVRCRQFYAEVGGPLWYQQAALPSTGSSCRVLMRGSRIVSVILEDGNMRRWTMKELGDTGKPCLTSHELYGKIITLNPFVVRLLRQHWRWAGHVGRRTGDRMWQVLFYRDMLWWDTTKTMGRESDSSNRGNWMHGGQACAKPPRFEHHLFAFDPHWSQRCKDRAKWAETENEFVAHVVTTYQLTVSANHRRGTSTRKVLFVQDVRRISPFLARRKKGFVPGIHLIGDCHPIASCLQGLTPKNECREVLEVFVCWSSQLGLWSPTGDFFLHQRMHRNSEADTCANEAMDGEDFEIWYDGWRLEVERRYARDGGKGCFFQANCDGGFRPESGLSAVGVVVKFVTNTEVVQVARKGKHGRYADNIEAEYAAAVSAVAMLNDVLVEVMCE